MKFTRKTLPVLCMLLLSFSSCDKLDELTEIDIAEDFSTTISVELDADSDLSWSENSTIDISNSMKFSKENVLQEKLGKY